MRRRLVRGTRDGPHVLRDGAGRPDGVVARELVNRSGEKRLEREMAAVLLADDHDDRCAVHAGGRDRGNGVAETRRRVQQRERGPVPADRPPVAMPTTEALVEREHELQVVRQAGENGISVEPGFEKIIVSP